MSEANARSVHRKAQAGGWKILMIFPLISIFKHTFKRSGAKTGFSQIIQVLISLTLINSAQMVGFTSFEC
jgi:hypothetical protein